MDKTSKNIFIAGLIFTIVGLTIAMCQVSSISKNAMASKWPVAEGRILVSKSIKLQSKPGGTETFFPKIMYEYTVDGVMYKNTIRYFGEAYVPDRRQSEDVVYSYPTGKTIMVYYNPKKHDEAAIEPRAHKLNYQVMVFGLVFTIIGVKFLFSHKKISVSQTKSADIELVSSPETGEIAGLRKIMYEGKKYDVYDGVLLLTLASRDCGIVSIFSAIIFKVAPVIIFMPLIGIVFGVIAIRKEKLVRKILQCNPQLKMDKYSKLRYGLAIAGIVAGLCEILVAIKVV